MISSVSMSKLKVGEMSAAGDPAPVTLGGGDPAPITMGGGDPAPVSMGGGDPGPVSMGGGDPAPVTRGLNVKEVVIWWAVDLSLIAWTTQREHKQTAMSKY